MFKFVIVACLCAAVLVQGQAPEDNKQQDAPPPPPGPPPSKFGYSRVARQAGMPGGGQMPGALGQMGAQFGVNAGASMGAGMPNPMDMMQQGMAAAQGMMPPMKAKRAAQDPMPPTPSLPPMP